MLVVACNTATCYTIPELRAKFSFPIVGTVPTIKPAAEMSKSKVIAVISTLSTAKSKMLKDLIKENATGVKVINISCQHLENAVDNSDLTGEKVEKLLRKYLEPIKKSKADYIVLGCTHYPFLKESIYKVMARPINLLDSGEAIAKRTKAVLHESSLQNENKAKGKSIYLTTGKAQKFSTVASTLLARKISTKAVKI